MKLFYVVTVVPQNKDVKALVNNKSNSEYKLMKNLANFLVIQCLTGANSGFSSTFLLQVLNFPSFEHAC